MNPYIKVEKHLENIETLLADCEIKVATLSGGKIGWHLMHSLLVIKNVLNALEKSNPTDYKWTFNRNRMLVFISGKIPRGKVKAPTPVNPEEEKVNQNELLSLLKSVRLSLDESKSYPKNSFFTHRIFGLLNKKSTLFFLHLHTKHHLEICLDIKKAFTKV